MISCVGVEKHNQTRVAFAGQARFCGLVTSTMQPRERVAQLLPDDLWIEDDSTGLNPIVFVMGEQHSGTALFGGVVVPPNVRYREFLLAVPGVHHSKSNQPHLFVPKMYASYFPAVWNGRENYGLSKELGEVENREGIRLLTDAGGALVLHALTESRSDWMSESDAPACWHSLRAYFDQPVLGRKPNGRYVRTQFDWDLSTARIRHIDCCTVVDATLPCGLEAGAYSGSDRSCSVRNMMWRVGWPEPCFA
jgi:hypothetical protein